MNRLLRQLAIATNWPVIVAVAVLSSLGVLTIWADTRNDTSRDWVKQIVFIGVGVACMAAIQAANYQRIGRWAWTFYIASLLPLSYTVAGAAIGGENPLPFVSRVNGAYNWIKLGSYSLQPSELTKIAFVVVLARYLRFRSNYRTLAGLLRPFGLALVPVALILKQPDLGTALTFIPALFAMLFVAGAKMKHLLAIVGFGAAMVPILWLCGPAVDGSPDLPVFRHLPTFVKRYQRDRVYAMFSKDPAMLQRTGFQQEHALIALGSGGITGKGAGVIPVGQRVPEAHNDMIFSLIGEQFGFIGSAAVIGAYMVLFAAGVEIAAATREPFGRLVTLGLVSLLAGQTFLNLMVTTRLMPVTGITLPFVSYGGSSLLASFIAAGLLLNVGQNRPLVMARESFEFSEK